MTTTIETYLNSLSEYILTLSIDSRGITSLPDLTRFKNLKELYCSDNQLINLPSNLPQGLEILYCSKNKLTSLPNLNRFKNLKELYCSINKLTNLPNNLPQGLEKLHCSNNELTSLPTTLPQNLKELNCSNNRLSSLPISLPQTIQILYCFDNKLIYLPTLPKEIVYFYYPNNPICNILDIDNNSLIKVKQNIKIVNNFRYLYYCLQFKKQLRKWLWEKVREKQIVKRYHPNYLLENLKKNTDLDEFLNNW
jgi:Leucine-rich repeat (LRR) protein